MGHRGRHRVIPDCRRRLAVQSIGARERQHMDPNRLTEKAQDAIRQAQSLAQRQGQTQIERRASRGGAARAGRRRRGARRREGGRQPGGARAAPPAGARPAAPGLGARALGGSGLPLASRERGPDRRRGRSPAHEGRVRERRAPAARARRPQGRRAWPRPSAPPASRARSCSRRWRPSGAASA